MFQPISRVSLEDRIIHYYDVTDSSYQNWGGGANEAYQMHYGYRDHPQQSHVDTLLRMNGVLADYAGIEMGEHVLDMGCGVGGSAIWLSKCMGAQVHGISLNQLHVDKARAFARQAQVPAQFSRQNFLQTNFPNRHFDVVWSLESFYYAEKKEDMVQEAWRLLRQNGRFVVAGYFLTRHFMNEVETFALNKWMDGWVIPRMEPIIRFEDTLTQTGFTDIECYDITENIMSSAIEIHKRGKEGYPDDLVVKNKSIVEIKHTEACLYQKTLLDMGLCRYMVFMGKRA